MTGPEAERASRRGSEKRARPHQVALRLSDDELALLDARAKRAGKTRASWLRYALLAWPGPPPMSLVCGCGTPLYAGVTHHCGTEPLTTASAVSR